MTDEEVEELILGEIERRGATWLDMVGGKCIAYHVDHRRIVRNNVFVSQSWSDRLIELVSDGDYDPMAEYHPIRTSIQDLIQFWWNHCVCHEHMIDEILEDIFVYFKDRLGPEEEEEPEPHYDVDFSELQEACFATPTECGIQEGKRAKKGGV